MITLQNVTKTFNTRQVFKNISIEIKANETVAILGPSGSGKTTLLRMIAGTLKPDSGTIETGSPRLGYIFQDRRLLPWRSAQDNIALALRSLGRTPLESQEKSRTWMDRLGLKGFYNYYPRQLSGGMQQRVSIARAFAIEPEIMLMDEPFSNLDTALSESLMHDLKQVLAEYKTTTVFVTHSLFEAVSIANRILKLQPAGIEETVVTDRKAMLQEYFEARLRGIA